MCRLRRFGTEYTKQAEAVWSGGGCCSNPKVAPYMHSHCVSKKYFLNFNFMYFFAVLVNILNVHDT